MPSIRSQLVALFVRATKYAFVSEQALLEDISRRRKVGPAAPSKQMHKHFSIGEEVVAGVQVYTIRPEHHAVKSHVMYLHGGAYISEITSHHWRYLARLVERTHCSVSVPLYPLAPESDCVKTVETMAHVFQQIHPAPHPPVVVMGDSAGGGLAVALCYALRTAGVQMPAGMVLLCPWLDVSMNHPDLANTVHNDPMLTVDGLRAAGRFYAREMAVTHPYASPLYGQIAGLPNALVFVGTRDILQVDGLAFAQALRREGADVDLQTGRDMIHVWPLLPIPEAGPALERVAGFIDRCIHGNA